MTDLKKVAEKPTQEEVKDSKVVNETPEKTEEYNLEIIRDYYGQVDITYLSNKDPNYEYRFLRDEFKNISIKTNNLLFQKGGWQLCQREHLLKIGIKPREIAPDGFYRVGDLILAFMPKKLYQEKMEYKKEKTASQMSRIRKMVDEGDASQGGKDTHETMKGIQTQKQLGM